MSSMETKQPYCLASQSSQLSNSQSPSSQRLAYLSAYKQLSYLFKNYKNNSKADFEAKVQEKMRLIYAQDEQKHESINILVKTMIASLYGNALNSPQSNQQQTKLVEYWTKCTNIQPHYRWSYSQCLVLSKSILVGKNSSQLQGVLAIKKCKPYIIYNNMICLYQLGMLQEALNMSHQIIDERHTKLIASVQENRTCIMIRMGLKAPQHNQNGQKSQAMKYLSYLQRIRCTGKEQLRTQVEKCQNKGTKLSLNNWYNLALACKKKQLHLQSISILQSLVNSSIGIDLANKCCILLTELFEVQKDYEKAIYYLKKWTGQSCKEVQLKLWCLKKKLKISKNDIQKIERAINIDPRFKLLNNLQNELRKTAKLEGLQTINEQRKTKRLQIVVKTARQIIAHQPIQQVRPIPVLKLNEKNQRSAVRFSHKVANKKPTIPKETTLTNISITSICRKKTIKPLTPRTCLNSVGNSHKSIKSNIYSAANTPREQLTNLLPIQITKKDSNKTKEKVRFDLTDSCSESDGPGCNYPEAFEQRITSHLFEEEFEAAMDEIKDAEDQLEQLEAEDKESAMTFTLKLSKWCRQAGKQRYATLLLKRVLPRYELGHQRIQLLRQLGRHYQELKEYKCAIEVNLELVRLGETGCLDKLGQMHMLRQNYSEALKYYERYHEIRNDTYSLVKLAHAYSKIPSYSKRAFQLLNDLLFINKTSCIFRPRTAADIEDFQSALLLLATIYMNLNGHKKAAQICDKYLKEDFGAYPIFYILGVLRLREERRQQAFTCFLNAIRLKPNHLPSLLELFRFLTSRSSQVLVVLRKAFLAHHRDWELLKLLVEAATKSRPHQSQLSISALIACAKALQGASQEGLQLEVQAVWLWAAELIDDRQRRISVVDQQFVENVYVRLGEIALKKGNYPLSERYFLKVLQKLQLERGRMKSKPKAHYLRLEIQILRRLAFLKSEQREQDAALRFIQQSRDTAAANGLPLQAVKDSQKIGQLHFVMENYAQAVKQFNRCCGHLEAQPGGIEEHWEQWKTMQLEIGNCYQNMRQWKEAKRVYQCILSHKLCQEAIRSLANLYAWQGSPELAKELLQGLRVIQPDPLA